MPRAYESITRLIIGIKPHHYIVRVWREEVEITDGDNADLYDMANTLLPLVDRQNSVKMITETYLGMNRVAAVEVTRGDTGRGTVTYADWP